MHCRAVLPSEPAKEQADAFLPRAEHQVQSTPPVKTSANLEKGSSQSDIGTSSALQQARDAISAAERVVKGTWRRSTTGQQGVSGAGANPYEWVQAPRVQQQQPQSYNGPVTQGSSAWPAQQQVQPQQQQQAQKQPVRSSSPTPQSQRSTSSPDSPKNNFAAAGLQQPPQFLAGHTSVLYPGFAGGQYTNQGSASPGVPGHLSPSVQGQRSASPTPLQRHNSSGQFVHGGASSSFSQGAPMSPSGQWSPTMMPKGGSLSLNQPPRAHQVQQVGGSLSLNPPRCSSPLPGRFLMG